MLTDSTIADPDWTYSATAEDNGIAGDLDGQPGVTYGGPAGVAAIVNVKVENLDISEGFTIAPEATDAVAVGFFVNSELQEFTSERFVSEIDTETAHEFSIATAVRMAAGDVLRVALQQKGEETSDWDIAEGGEWSIK